ncbi:MAG: hypothetical protein MAG794_01194 [Gammaproteobacteria bacterium]|nr:hypothetical protein [Gammaproteobacteria bacterium]
MLRVKYQPMPRNTRKPSWLLTKKQVLAHRYLQIFGNALHNPNLWHFNRRSVANATAIGLFCAFLPMPFEMLAAALGAIWFSGNLPLAVAWVWISNPVSWIPLYTPAYLLGSWILDKETAAADQVTMSVLIESLAALWIGCLIFGVIAGACGYMTIKGLWRLKIRSERADRRRRTKLKQN